MTQSIPFDVPASLPFQVSFDGLQLTSDGGLCWLSEADTVLGLYAGQHPTSDSHGVMSQMTMLRRLG